MAVIFSDNFNRADSTDLGSDWDERRGASEISGNAVIPSSVESSEAVIRHTGGPYSTADYTVECDMVSVVSFEGPLGRCADYSTTDTDYYAVFWSGSTLYLYKKISGSYTFLASVGDSTSPPATVKLSMEGTAIKGYLNDSNEISSTDSSLSSAGDAGIKTANGAVANRKQDTFIVTEIGGGGGISIPVVMKHLREQRIS